MNGRNFLPAANVPNQNPWENFGFFKKDKSANSYLDKIPGTIKPYFNPYIESGGDAYNTMNPILDQMTKDPAAFLDAMMKNYEPSKGYQMKLDQMKKAAGNTAAAGGMRGSLGDISNEAKLTDMLMGEDMQQWLQNVFGIQGRGLSGESHIFDTGYDASKSLAGDLSNILGTQGQLAFQRQRDKDKQSSDLWSGITGLAGAAIGRGGFL